MDTSVQSSAGVKLPAVAPEVEDVARQCITYLNALLVEHPFVREFIVTTNGARFIACGRESGLIESGQTLAEAIMKLRATIPTDEVLAARKRECAAKLLAEADALTATVVPVAVIQDREGRAA